MRIDNSLRTKKENLTTRLSLQKSQINPEV